MDTDHNGALSEEELNALTKAQIRTVADEKGYTVTGTTKAELITSFLSAQSTAETADIDAADANENDSYSQAELETLTIHEINELASDLSYTISGATKAALIQSFLAAQGAAMCSLTALSIGSLTLTPTFSAATTTYTTTTENDTDTITATAGSGTTVEILNGEDEVESGSAATWGDGANIVTVTVTKGDAVRVYTVTVTKSAAEQSGGEGG